MRAGVCGGGKTSYEWISRLRRWKTSPTMPASVIAANKAFCACLPEKLRAKYEKLDAEEEARARQLRLVVPSRMALTTPT